MTQEDKNLVKQYVCMSIPFGLKAQIKLDNEIFIGTIYGVDENSVIYVREGNDYKEDTEFEDIKPYLRSLSSMTESERKEFDNLSKFDEDVWMGNHKVGFPKNVRIMNKCVDWLNKNMFDYRGLILMGLALEAPEGMYK